MSHSSNNNSTSVSNSSHNPSPTPINTKTTNSRNKSRHPGKAILAGGLSGAIEISITYPTEYVKTQMQLYENVARAGPATCVRNTLKSHGVFGLYRGLSCLLFFSIPKNASRFFAYEKMRSILESEDGHLSPGRTVLCGLGSGIFEALTVVTPMETLKVKLIHDQLQHAKHERKYKNLFHGTKTIIEQQGLRGTYQGALATVLKQGSNQAIRWLVYSQMKAYLSENSGGKSPADLGPLKTAFAGATAGAASVLGNTPLDVVKTRMQGLNASRYNGILDCVKSVWRDEGFLAFYKGVTPRLCRVCADVAIVMVVYEQVMKALDYVWNTD